MNEKQEEKPIENQNNSTNSLGTDSKSILEFKDKFYDEAQITPEVKNVLDDVFEEMISEQSESKDMKDVSKFKNNSLDYEEIDKIHALESEQFLPEDSGEREVNSIVKEDSNEKLNELKNAYKNKIKEIAEKSREYRKKYTKLDELTNDYERRNSEMLEKRIEFENKIKEYEAKNQELEAFKEEFKNRNISLQEAREQFTRLSKQLEGKKNELEKREKKIDKLQQSLEKNRLELEKNKIELEKDKLDLEIEKSKNEEKDQILEISNKPLKKEKKRNIDIQLKNEPKGKIELLEDLLRDMSSEGYFQSCFLIDNKGMLISEYSQIELDRIAIGAMFSLISTSALRTVDSLRLQELLYFKLASVNGEFMIKNILISNYPRNFILIAYYEKSDSQDFDLVQKIDKKTIKEILKNIKRDFYDFLDESKISWAFENIKEKIDFLKMKYKIPDSDLEIIRKNVLNKVALEIRKLFEI